jgi:hypothetical protein
MAVQPITPLVYGPIYPISPSIHVAGLFQGAVVSVDGSESGSIASVTYDGFNPEAWIPILKQPVAGEYILVEQSIAGVSSGEPAPPGTVVLPVPNPLPIPEISQHLHTCSDYILLDNLLPGGEITVQKDGLTYVEAQIQQTPQYFLLDPNLPVAVGDVFTVWQTVNVPGGTLQSDAVRSLPLENLELSNPLPTPGMQPSPVACTADATFDNLILGAYLNWSNAGEVWWVDSVNGGTEEWSWGGPVLKAGPITAQQSFNRCEIASDVFHGTVLPAPALKAPIVADGLCIEATQFHVSGLNVPCTLNIIATLGPAVRPSHSLVILQPIKRRWMCRFPRTGLSNPRLPFLFIISFLLIAVNDMTKKT